MFKKFASSIALSALIAGNLLAFTAAPASASSTTASQLLASLPVSAPSSAPYDRALFPHWIDADKNGCDTRREVLIAESIITPVVGAGCSVTGRWKSAYDGLTVNSPSGIEIDHVVALKEAWVSGAHAWTTAQRRDFANDLDFAGSLIAVSSASNQQKGASDPSRWLPATGVCDYAITWMGVKHRWRLSIDSAEKVALSSIASGSCGARTVSLPSVRADVAATAGASSFGNGTTRVFGSDRYETALKLSASFSAGVPVVYVATGTNYPDALSAAPAAAAQGGPLLLVPPNSLPSAVANELRRLKPKQIVVVGGEGAVSRSVYSSLSGLAPSIRRDAGADRYATSRIVVERAFTSAPRTFIASGANFPDALSASAAAGSAAIPVVLVNGAASRLDGDTVRTLSRLGVSSIAIAGGTGVVSAGIANDAKNRFGSSRVVRHGGADRYSTSALINKASFGSANSIFLAVGTNFADALAGAAVAGQLNAPLYVVPRDCVPADIKSHITALAPKSVVVLGGPTVLTTNVASLKACGTTSSSPPKNPGDTKNCSDFATQREAQAWFDRYFPYYGDVARLDADKDGRACDTLP